MNRLTGSLLSTALVVLASVALATPGTASAQVDVVAAPMASDGLSPEATEALAAIDDQATTAAILLGTGIPLHILGLIGIAGGLLAGVGAAFGGGDGTTAGIIGLVGAVAASVGLIEIIVGGCLDVGSGVRRRRWRERYDPAGALSGLTPVLAPSSDGLTLGVVGWF